MIERVGTVTIVGTAHVSQASVDEVLRTLEAEKPRCVCVELDQRRLEALENPDAWMQRPLTKVLKDGSAPAVLAQTFLAAHQRAIAAKSGVRPGAEMLAAVQWARASGADLVLADRDVGVTLRRAWRRMGLREKSRVLWEFFATVVGAGQPVEDVDKLLEEAALTEAMDDLASAAPRAKEVLVDERDTILASRIHAAAAKGPCVAVLGAGHVKGVKRQLEAGPRTDTGDLEVVPPAGFPWGKAIGIALALLAIGLLTFITIRALMTGEAGLAVEALLVWTLVTGSLCALGTLIAGGHILSILTAFVAAPFTTLHPALAAGWFAGLVEATVRKPTVGDLQGLSAVKAFADFRRNGVLRVLLVTALANLGASIGAFIGIGTLVRLVSQVMG